MYLIPRLASTPVPSIRKQKQHRISRIALSLSLFLALALSLSLSLSLSLCLPSIRKQQRISGIGRVGTRYLTSAFTATCQHFLH